MGIEIVFESTAEYFKKYKVYGEILASVCSDLSLPTYEFKLYNYIMIEGYMKSKEGRNYFIRPQPRRVNTLLTMLNELDRKEVLKAADGIPEIRGKMDEHMDELLNPAEIERIDSDCKDCYGLPYSLKEEISDRLKMHTDKEFASAKLQFFEEYIVPRLKGYDQKKIDESIEQERERFDNVNQLFSPDNLPKKEG